MSRTIQADGPYTVTHARLRAAQGDRARARRILSEILRVTPDDRAALALLERVRGRSPAEETAAPASPRPMPRDPELTASVRRATRPKDPRVDRLERWLARFEAAR